MDRYYDSSAHVVIDGEEHPAHVRFSIYTNGGLRGWHGKLQPDDPTVEHALFQAHEARLLMPDGKEGVIIATASESGGLVHFTGSGPAPVSV